MEGLVIPHPHDKRWYNEQLAKLSSAARDRARDGYRQIWLDVYYDNEGEIAQINRARHAANTRLRVFVDKIAKQGLRL